MDLFWFRFVALSFKENRFEKTNHRKVSFTCKTISC